MALCMTIISHSQNRCNVVFSFGLKEQNFGQNIWDKVCSYLGTYWELSVHNK
jgi:hypothetical protein